MSRETPPTTWREFLDQYGDCPGPWHVAHSEDDPEHWWLDNEQGDSAFMDGEDAAFVLNNLPALLDERDRLIANEPICQHDGDEDASECPGAPR